MAKLVPTRVIYVWYPVSKKAIKSTASVIFKNHITKEEPLVYLYDPGDIGTEYGMVSLKEMGWTKCVYGDFPKEALATFLLM